MGDRGFVLGCWERVGDYGVPGREIWRLLGSDLESWGYIYFLGVVGVGA